MPRPKRKVPLDPPEKIRARERMRPPDFSIIKPKEGDFLERFHVRWVQSGNRRMGEMRAKYGYVPVTRTEVEAPAAWGDKTGRYIVHGDLILCKCPKQEYDERQADMAFFHKLQLEDRYEQMEEEAASGGAKITQSLTVSEQNTEDETKEVLTIGNEDE